MKGRFGFVFPEHNTPPNPFKTTQRGAIDDAEFFRLVQEGVQFVYTPEFEIEFCSKILSRLAELRPYVTTESKPQLLEFLSALEDRLLGAAAQTLELRQILEAR